MKKLTGTLVATATAVSGGAAIGGAPPAAADGYVVYTADAVLIRTDAYLSSPAVGQGYPGDATTYACYRIGDYVYRDGDPLGNKFWNYHANHTRGVKGFSSDAYTLVVAANAQPYC